MADNTLLQLPYNAVRLGIERDKTSINIDELNRFDQNINNRYDHSILTDIDPDTIFLSTDNVQSILVDKLLMKNTDLTKICHYLIAMFVVFHEILMTLNYT